MNNLTSSISSRKTTGEHVINQGAFNRVIFIRCQRLYFIEDRKYLPTTA